MTDTRIRLKPIVIKIAYVIWVLLLSLIIVSIVYNKHIMHTSAIQNHLPFMHHFLVAVYNFILPAIYQDYLFK